MKKAAYILLLALFAACTNQEEPNTQGQALPEGKYPITIGLNVATPATNTPTTRITDDASGQSQWQGGEEVAVRIDGTVKKYVVKKDGDKVTLEAADGVTPFYWQHANEDMEAWYPYNGGSLPTAVQADQSTNGGYSNSYILYGKATLALSGSKSLTMYHQTAKVVVNIKNGSGPTTDQITKIVIGYNNHLYLNGSFTPPSGVETGGTWTTNKALGTVSCKNITTVSGFLKSYAAMVIPQRIDGAVDFIAVSVSDKTFCYKTKNQITLQAGGVHTFSLELNPRIYTASNSDIRISGSSEYIIEGNGTETTGKIFVNGDAKVTLKNINIKASEHSIVVQSGNPTFILEGQNILTSESSALYNVPGTTITIEGAGELKAVGGYNCASIGGGNYEVHCGKIIIKGGIISASGIACGAGIGCGFNSNCEGIEILGGTVIATIDNSAYRRDMHAIGDSQFDSGLCEYIKLSKCTIKAYPYYNGAAFKAKVITPDYTDKAALKAAGVTIYIKDILYTE